VPLQINDENRNFFDEVSHGRMDGEADIFNYNFGNYTGKFVLTKKADGAVAFMDKQNGLEVKYDETARSWTIKDGQGYRYVFGTKESIVDEYSYSDTNELSDNAPLEWYSKQTSGAVTAWYLDEIEAPTGEKINFTYANKSIGLSVQQRSERESRLINMEGYCSSASPRFANIKTFSASRQSTYEMCLTRIDFKNGSVEFNTTDRTDIEYIGFQKPQKLSEILVKDLQDSQIKRFVLSQGYNSGRLQLNAVTEYGSDEKSKPPHTFSYFPGQLPSLTSKAVDHWGLFNGQSNGGLIPESFITLGTEIVYYAGGKREGTTNIEYLKRGVLSSITYPTGGKTEFDFELNSYGNNLEDSYLIQDNFYNVLANDGKQYEEAEKTFTIAEPSHMDLTFFYSRYSNFEPDLFAIERVYVNLPGKTQLGAQVPLHYSNYWQCSDQPPCSSGSDSRMLQPGKYTLRVEYTPGYHVEAQLRMKRPIKLAFDANRTGGGIRVKSITNFDNGKEISFRKFIYTLNGQEDGITSGKLLSHPKYSYLTSIVDQPTNSCQPYIGTFLTRMSSSVYWGGLSSTGSTIGYDVVTEVLGHEGEGGKTEYTYRSYPDVPQNHPLVPPYVSPYNGKLTQYAMFDVAGNPLKKVEYNYISLQQQAITECKLYQEHFPEVSGAYQISFYNDISEWIILSTEKETLFKGNSKNVNFKKYNYSNPAHKELTSQEFTKSDGTLITTKFKYPHDYTGASANSFVVKMKENHVISPVIEEQTLMTKNSQTSLLSGSFTEYKLFNNKFYKPYVISSFEGAIPNTTYTESSISSTGAITMHPNYKPKITFHDYDASGNITWFQQPNNNPESYLWNYNATYPVAQVTNAIPAEIAYTSFEADDLGRWNCNVAKIISPQGTSSARTGLQFYELSSGNTLSRNNLPIGKKFTITYWSSTGPLSIQGATQNGSVVTGKTINGWTYIEHQVTTTASDVIISGSGNIDEVRLYPSTARMTTYTYDPTTGLTDVTDANGNITHYNYDSFQRLKTVNDGKGSILKSFDYKYAGQQ
jgi:YD repeat-containing protein